MNRFKILILVLFFVFSINNAKSQTNQSFRLSILGGNGFGTNTKISSSMNTTLQPYGFGIGIRAQYVFESKLSLGVIFVMHKGESVTVNTIQNTLPLTIKARIQYGGIELGYRLILNHTFSMYPHIGIGLGERKGNFFPESGDIPGPNDITVISVDGFRPYISPAASVIADVTNFLFLGLEVNYLVLTDYKNANSFGTFLIAGINISGLY
ncbi:MAG: outer membrane beta-barrel protein [Ignavibacteriaceae bacterium]